MKRYLKGIYMSFGMFCAIPLPVSVWDDACMNLMLPCFPMVGLLIGALWWLAASALAFSGIHIVITSAITALLPFFLTGFLHLDGFMDTGDAVLSRRPLEDKLRILKDPHTGAFAVIMLGCLFVMQFAALFAIMEDGKYLALLIAVTVLSRCCSSLALLCLKTMTQSGYANMFRQNTGMPHKAFICLVAVFVIAVAYLLTGTGALIVTASVIVGFSAAMSFAYKDLKGVSGDLAGFALVISELCGLIAMSVI